MIGRRLLIALLVLGGFTFFGANRVAAEGCAGQATVLDGLVASKHVVILKVITVEPSPYANTEEGAAEVVPETDPSPQTTTLEVIRTYKGSFKPGEILNFGQYAASEEGGWTFESTDVGKEFLFYLSDDNWFEGRWWPDYCGRNRRMEDATDDLLFLNNAAKLMGKTRVSGTVTYHNNEGNGIEGITIRFTGATRNYFAKTDAHGVYEIYDLPVGKYRIGAQLPAGWKLDEDYFWVDEGEVPENAPPTPKFQIKVVAKKHVAMDLYIKIDNSIRGRIYFPGGGSLANEWIKATRADGTDPDGYYTAMIEADGSFSLNGLPSGGYVIVVNEGGVVSSSMPFSAFYYPGVTDKTLATVLYVGPGQTVNGINISAPAPAETITISGRLLYADGSPIADKLVDFTTGTPDPLIYGDASASTDAEGRFTLRILKGQTGNLAGHFFSYIGEYVDSPELEAAIRAAAEAEAAAAAAVAEPEPTPEAPDPSATPDPSAAENTEVPQMVYANLSTDAVEITAEKDVNNMEFHFPFTAGKKAPEPAQ